MASNRWTLNGTSDWEVPDNAMPTLLELLTKVGKWACRGCQRTTSKPSEKEIATGYCAECHKRGPKAPREPRAEEPATPR